MEEHHQAEEARPGSMSPPRPLKVAQEVAPPPGFWEGMACLQRDPSPATAFEAPPETLWLEAAIESAVAMMCVSHIVQDEAMGMIYMDTVTTSVGQVALGAPCLVIQTPTSTTEDITNLP